MNRYTVAGSEGQFEKNSDERVWLINSGIADANEIDSVELVLLEQLYRSVFEEHFPTGLLSVDILKKVALSLVRQYLCMGRPGKNGQYQQRRFYVRPFSAVGETAKRF